MPTAQLFSGEVIEYPTPAPEVAAFLERLRAAAADPAVSVGEFMDLLSGSENPILDREFVPGKYYVTRKVFDNPVYRVMSDMIATKQINLGLLDPEKVAATYTLSVNEAAERLDMTPEAVRTAIAARKLGGHLRNGEWYVHPRSIDAYQYANRGLKLIAKDEGESVRKASV